MTSDNILVQLQGIAKTYDGKANVLEALNLDIYEGEFLTLLGPSGSGKTTVLMMLAGFEPATAGSILLDGRRLNDVPPHKRNMGVVFQSYALFPHMTVTQNVGYPLKHRKVGRSKRATCVADALKMVGLAELGSRFPSQLSGGQQQRVALARALVFEPEIVLMDEPLGALDKNLREQMQLELKRLHKQLGMTVVFVTHDQGEALTMSDRVAVFNHGRILQIGRPDEIYERPNCSFVANFIGENNNLSGAIKEAANGKACVKLANGQFIHTANPAGFKAGEHVNVTIRPEQLLINREGGDGYNHIVARVSEIIYHGDHQRIEVEVDGVECLTVKTRYDDRVATLEVGGQVNVSWAVCDGIALDSAGKVRSGS